MDYLLIRMTSSFLTGVILSQTGSLTQIGTRNILASPSTLGFDGLAVLWLLIFHSVALYLGMEYSAVFIFLAAVPLFVIIGILFSKLLSRKKKLEGIILLGITFNLLVGAIFSLCQFLFMAFNMPFPTELWFGHFRYSSEFSLLVLIAVEFLIIVSFKIYSGRLKLFTTGPFMARNWQLDEKKLFNFIFVTVALGTLSVVTLFGAFSFLGLVFPIVARKLWFKHSDLSGEVMIGAVLNGSCLMAVDALCYFNPIYGAEIPVGLIATGVGALSLIFILWSSYKDS